MIIPQQSLHHLQPKKLTYANFIGQKDFITSIKVISHKTMVEDTEVKENSA